MKITIEQKELQRGLNRVIRAVDPKPQMEVFGCVLLTTDDERLKLYATNREIAVTCWLPCTVYKPGTAVVPAKLLSDVVGNLIGEEIALGFCHHTQSLRIDTGSPDALINASIRGYPAEDYPVVPNMTEGHVETLMAKIKAHLLHEMIEQVIYAASTSTNDSNRLSLTGAQFQFIGNRLSLCATDNFRLARCTAPLLISPARDLAVIVPSGAVNELTRIAESFTEPIELIIAPERHQMLCRAPGVEVWSQLLPNKFPDWRQVVPQGFDNRVVVDRSLLLNLLKLSDHFARSDNERVYFNIVPGDVEDNDGHLLVSADTTEGDTNNRLVASVIGPARRIAFNGRYVRDALGAVRSPHVVLETTEPNGPGVIRSSAESTELSDQVHLVLRLHLRE